MYTEHRQNYFLSLYPMLNEANSTKVGSDMGTPLILTPKTKNGEQHLGLFLLKGQFS